MDILEEVHMLQVLRLVGVFSYIVLAFYFITATPRLLYADLITTHGSVPLSKPVQSQSPHSYRGKGHSHLSVNLKTNPVYSQLSQEFKNFADAWRHNHPIPSSTLASVKCPESSNNKVYVYMTKYMFNNPLTVKRVMDTINPKKRNLTIIFVVVTDSGVSLKNYPPLNGASLDIARNSGVEIEDNPQMIEKLRNVGEPYFVLDSIYSLKAEGKIDDFKKIYNAVTPIYY